MYPVYGFGLWAIIGLWMSITERDWKIFGWLVICPILLGLAFSAIRMA